MEAFNNYLTAKGYSKSTIKETINSVSNLLLWTEKEGLNINELSYNEMMSYVAAMQKIGMQIQSVKQRTVDLKRYFVYLTETGVRTDNPIKSITIKGGRKKVISSYFKEIELEEMLEQFKQQIKLIPKNNSGLKEAQQLEYELILSLVIHQGLDAGDLSKLLTTDVNLNDGTINVAESKTRRFRVLKLEAKQIIPLMRFTHGRREEKLFKSNINNQLNYIKTTLKKLLQKDVNIQQLRASRIILWLRLHSIIEVQYFTGFKYLSSLESYRMADVEGLRGAIEEGFPI